MVRVAQVALVHSAVFRCSQRMEIAHALVAANLCYYVRHIHALLHFNTSTYNIPSKSNHGGTWTIANCFNLLCFGFRWN